MPVEFHQRLERLHHDIVQQGQRVEAIIDRAFQAIFESNKDLAKEVMQEDDLIDRVDIEIERSAVELLSIGETNQKQLRMVLTIVKANNELERIADLGADIAEQVVLISDLHDELPGTVQVMTNSVIGMIRDGNAALRDLDSSLARNVLTRDDLVDEFKRRILKEVQQQLIDSACSVDFASAIWQIAAAIERIADHTTNICEQVIYVETAQIVRHTVSSGWSDPEPI
ncbi:MAG: phosphate transport system regulatory protein PhoU [Planctomycetes bacterium]|nr:phosphate transport system regulatory protein PhoU [Planctomycetota bacterium]NOG52780.1 phosphate signaling complex protein PhoU [Planctomycetota bacterium]